MSTKSSETALTVFNCASDRHVSPVSIPSTHLSDAFIAATGFGHGDGSFVPAWDALGALDKWSTKGEVPGTLVATDSGASFGRSRPLCPYPGFPKFNGTGSSYLASSFTCANS